MAIACALAIPVLIALAALTSACAPTVRATGRCPTFAPLLTDFVLAGTALGASVDRYSAGETGQTMALVGVAAAIGLAANLSECRR